MVNDVPVVIKDERRNGNDPTPTAEVVLATWNGSGLRSPTRLSMVLQCVYVSQAIPSSSWSNRCGSDPIELKFRALICVQSMSGGNTGIQAPE